MKEEWKKIVSGKGVLKYEGYTINGKPHGSGTSYYPNGNKYQEGVFDFKGLVYGREYYRNGNVRFEGAYRICKGYGPNYPVYGACYDEDGNEYYSGKLEHSFGGVGYPTVTKPEEYGPVCLRDTPKIEMFMWSDSKADREDICYVKTKDKDERIALIVLLDQDGFVPEQDGQTTKVSVLESRFPVMVDVGNKVYGHLSNTICAAAAVSSKRVVSVKEFYEVFKWTGLDIEG